MKPGLLTLRPVSQVGIFFKGVKKGLLQEDIFGPYHSPSPPYLPPDCNSPRTF